MNYRVQTKHMIYQAILHKDDDTIRTLRLWANNFESAYLEIDRYNAHLHPTCKERYYLVCAIPEKERPYDVDLPMFEIVNL